MTSCDKNPILSSVRFEVLSGRYPVRQLSLSDYFCVKNLKEGDGQLFPDFKSQGIFAHLDKMKTFYRDVNKRSRKEMVEFLSKHYRYHTANSWNNSTSYAHNLKVHNLGLDHETVMKLYDLIQCEDFYDNINDLIEEFGANNEWKWQAGFNGRSGGYLVLYQGERKPSGYKSYCPHCRQLNYKTVAESNNICGRCRKEGRRDFATTHMVISAFPGRRIDYNENFEDWEMYQLRERVKLVQSFDKLADAIVEEAIYLAKEYTVEQEEYIVKKTRPILVAKEA